MPSCALTYLRTASGSSDVDGVAYSAIGILPSVVSTSASTARSSGMPATAKPGQAGARGAAAGKAGGGRRVRMHDTLHVGTLAVDLEMHQHLGRGVTIALELPAF